MLCVINVTLKLRSGIKASPRHNSAPALARSLVLHMAQLLQRAKSLTDVKSVNLYIIFLAVTEKSHTFAPLLDQEPVSNRRRDGRVVDYNGLENRRAERHRGFESLSLRQSQRNEL